MRLRWLLYVPLVLLAGCAVTGGESPLSLFQTKGEIALQAGIKNYEEGDYRDALIDLQSALGSGLNKSAEIRAHKYSAFVYCVTGKEKLCRDEFKKVLELDPAFNLDAAEAGHPMWGPVFRGVKAADKNRKSF